MAPGVISVVLRPSVSCQLPGTLRSTRGVVKDKRLMTLDRVLSRLGWSSRTEARRAILGGRVKVNGRTVRDPDRWVCPERDALHLDGQRLRQARRIYLLLNKPKGVITSHGDPGGRRTIYDCLGDAPFWVSPVGCLDRDSSGLLLLTNDTEFVNYITEVAGPCRSQRAVKESLPPACRCRYSRSGRWRAARWYARLRTGLA
jgi:hypothetical protein